jgi:hypothetical protein
MAIHGQQKSNREPLTQAQTKVSLFIFVSCR